MHGNKDEEYNELCRIDKIALLLAVGRALSNLQAADK